MKITRDILVDLSNELVEKRFKKDSKVEAIFLVGSVRPEEAILDQACDVDLLILHNGEIPRERELVKISNEYHFDLFFEETAHYNNPKELRTDGWRGWAMWDPMLIHQNNRFFEYTQSVLRSQFDDPKNIIGRVKYFLQKARGRWNVFENYPEKINPREYLKAVFDAGNAFACLNQHPFTKRRFLSEFYSLATTLEQDDLVPMLFSCISNSKQPDLISGHMEEWEKSFVEATKAYSTYTIHPNRLNYFKSSINSQLKSDFPLSAFWPFAFTWAYIGEEHAESKIIASNWKKISSEIGFDTPSLLKKNTLLDSYLERVEEIVEQVSEDYGIE